MIKDLVLAQVTHVSFQEKSNLDFKFRFPNLGIFNPHHFLVDGWIFSHELKIEKLELKNVATNQTIKQIDVNLNRSDIVKNLESHNQPQDDLIGFHCILDISEITQEEETIVAISAFSSKVEFPIGNFSICKISINKEKLYPDFIIAGSMKCGTTALYDYICKHPCVLNRVPKELHYFTLNSDKNDSWYRKFFYRSTKLFIGESSPSYFDFSRKQAEIPRTIKKNFPEVKIIILLRNPTDRAISHFYHDKSRLGIQKQEIDILADDSLRKPFNEHPYIEHGLYGEKIKLWQSVFPSDSLLFVNNQELLENTESTMMSILSFLGLSQSNFPLNILKPVYSNKYPKAPFSVISSLDDFFKDNNAKVKELTGIDLNLR